jgi:hemin uptake protein HemP
MNNRLRPGASCIANDSQSRYTQDMIRRSPPPAAARLDSASLLRGQVEVEILHGEEVYRLRHTRAGKLILTK